MPSQIFKSATEAQLGLTLWQGEYEGLHATWLRWTDARHELIPTGAECAAAEKQRADIEKQRADTEKQRADSEQQRAELAEQQARAEQHRAEKLAARLRELGIEPE